MHDYMDNVKVPGQKPRGSKSFITNSALTKRSRVNNINNTSSITVGISVLSLLKDKRASDKVMVTAYDNLKEPGKASSQSGSKPGSKPGANQESSDGNNKIESQTPNVKNEVQWMNVKNEGHISSRIPSGRCRAMKT
jgi:Arf-GAP with GTPase, ANK repeat and PH domain-containing protein 1/3/4/5/6/9/11